MVYIGAPKAHCPYIFYGLSQYTCVTQRNLPELTFPVPPNPLCNWEYCGSMGGSFHPGPLGPGGRGEGTTGSEVLRRISGVDNIGGPAVLYRIEIQV